jgi:2-methylcitrate dehydratase PrpD
VKHGGTFKKRVESPKGHLMNRMTDQDLEEKFHGMAEKYMTERQIKKLITTVYEMEKLDDTHKLMKAMVFKG